MHNRLQSTTLVKILWSQQSRLTESFPFWRTEMVAMVTVGGRVSRSNASVDTFCKRRLSLNENFFQEFNREADHVHVEFEFERENESD